MYNTIGVPLEISIPYIHSQNGIPDWLDIYEDALRFGVNWKRLKDRIRLIILDTYGKEFCDGVISTLDDVDRIGLNRIKEKLKGP